MSDAHQAKMKLGEWFLKMLDELDEDNVNDPEALDDLRGRVAEAFAEWRISHGYVSPGWEKEP